MSAEGDASKRAAARAALDYVVDGAVIGVGTGSTVNFFIEALIPYRTRVRAAISSSNASTERLRAGGITVLDLNDVDELGVYVDGADEATRARHLIKGGGAASRARRLLPPLRRSSSASRIRASWSSGWVRSHSPSK